MRALVPACVLLLAGCYVHARVPASPPPAPPPAVAPPSPAAQGISRDEAIDIAFAVARERGLEVTRVKHAQLDGAGRWHVELRGRGDRARMLLDASDGRLLRGKFREHDPDRQD
jgi:hypothetical protein